MFYRLLFSTDRLFTVIYSKYVGVLSIWVLSKKKKSGFLNDEMRGNTIASVDSLLIFKLKKRAAGEPWRPSEVSAKRVGTS